MLGGKIGGKLGTISKPLLVRIIFVMVMLFLAVKLGIEPVKELFL